MLHKLFIPIFRYNNKRVAILGNIRRKIKKHNGAVKFKSFTAPEKEYTYEGCFTACQKR